LPTIAVLPKGYNHCNSPASMSRKRPISRHSLEVSTVLQPPCWRGLGNFEQERCVGPVKSRSVYW